MGRCVTLSYRCDFMVKKCERYVGARKLFLRMKFMCFHSHQMEQKANRWISPFRKMKWKNELVTKVTTIMKTFSDCGSLNRLVSIVSHSLYGSYTAMYFLFAQIVVNDLFFFYKRANSLVYHHERSGGIPKKKRWPPNCFEEDWI